MKQGVIIKCRYVRFALMRGATQDLTVWYLSSVDICLDSPVLNGGFIQEGKEQDALSVMNLHRRKILDPSMLGI